jgi:cobalt transporter subunit CbtB
MTAKSKTIARYVDTATLEKAPAIGTALLLGFFLFYGVAFASPMEVHNAAHDGRHTFSFPCH